jgi:hypothetical protein
MPSPRNSAWAALALLAVLGTAGLVAAQPPAELPPPRPVPAADAPPQPPGPGLPPWLPRYDLDIRLDVDHHTAYVRQRVTFNNRHQRPAEELVFNAHSHYTIPKNDIGLLAKTLEIMRMMPGEAIFGDEPALEVQRVSLDGRPLPFGYPKENPTALVATLPRPVQASQCVTVEIEFVFHLPEKQGRWGCWEGVTTLSNWLPVLAVYDEQGWHPTPFVPWHQPFFNEAGIYTVRVTLPEEQVVATTGSVVAVHKQGDGLKQVDILAAGVRDFAFLCSARYCEYACQVGPVRVRCIALPQHEHYAQEIVKTACAVLPVYQQWFGPYPWTELTFAESYFGWNGNECATLVMIDERVFQMPHLAGGYVEYLIAHETCHQWWYNLLGTNGYCETWMDEAMANYFAHRFLNQKYGCNNELLHYPAGLEWLPNIKRDNYRFYGLYGTLGRGEATPVVQEMEKFGHVITLFSMCYDKGGKIVGMIEDRLGPDAFIDFQHLLYQRYQYKIIRVADYQRELEAYTGRSWEEFFHNWLYGTGLTDWSVEKVDLECQGKQRGSGWGATFLQQLHAGEEAHQPHKVTVLLHQKDTYNEQTVLGFCLDDSDTYQIRIPIQPQVPLLQLDDPPCRVEVLPENRVKVEVLLPTRPTQVTVDPDKVLVDTDPSNNSWKPPIRWRFAPVYTFLEETSLTCDYDRWNVIFGPWFYSPTYQDPWYTRQTMAGVRAGLYRTEYFTGGAYAAYRTDFRDVVVGADALWDHTPLPTTQIGFNVEHRIAQVVEEQPNVTRATLFGRYVFQYGDSLYLPPMHYLELFTDYQDNFLPYERHFLPGAVRFDSTANAGLHYSINYLTPYWDPQGGFQLDATYAGGVVDAAGHQGLNLVDGQLSYVQSLPDLDGWLSDYPNLAPLLGPPLHWLSETRFAFRTFGAGGLPNKGEYFTLGGEYRFRGFDLRERQGSLVWVGSVEWRVPLVRRVEWDMLDHMVGVRNVYAAAFYDVGDAYANGHSFGPVAHALGMGLRVDTAFLGVVERATLRLDVAKAINADTGVQVWVGVMHPF